MNKYFIKLSPKPIAARFCAIAVAALPMICALSVLYQYLFYLNNIPSPFIAYHYSENWFFIKGIIFLVWLSAVFIAIRLSQRRLSLTRATLIRLYVAGIVFCISVVPFDPPDIDLTPYFFINSVAYGVLGYVFFSVPNVRRYSAFLGTYILRLFRLPGVYWMALAFVWVGLAAYYLSGLLFQHFPWLDDTIAQLVHAKFLARGHWYGASEKLPDFFRMKLMINDGKWYSQYPPGHVMLLALGTLFNHADMVNPLLGACTCIAVYLLAKELYGTHVAKIAVLLTALCSYVIILSSEYMSNATSLLTGTLFLWAYFCVLHRPGIRYALIAGAALGYCFITRPYSAFGLALPAVMYAMYLASTQPAIYWKPMETIAAVFLCFVLFQLYYNDATTGNAFVFGYQQLQGDKHNPFSSEAAVDRVLSEKLYRNLRFNLQRLAYFNRILFEWPLPAMALVALVFGVRGHRRDERLLFLTILSMFLSVQFVANLDIGWGPRLLYELNGILLVLCAKSLSMLPALLRKLLMRRYRLSYYYGCGMSLLVSFYVFAWMYNFEIPTIREFYHFDHREGSPKLYKTILQHIDPPALVFISPRLYKFVAFTNPPSNDSTVVFAIDSGPENNELIAQYPNRNVFRIVIVGDHIKIIKQRLP